MNRFVGPTKEVLSAAALLWCLTDMSEARVLACFRQAPACEQHAGGLRGGVCFSLSGVPTDVLTGRAGDGRTETSAEDVLRQPQTERGAVAAPKRNPR